MLTKYHWMKSQTIPMEFRTWLTKMAEFDGVRKLPEGYTKIRDSFIAKGMSTKAAKTKLLRYGRPSQKVNKL